VASILDEMNDDLILTNPFIPEVYSAAKRNDYQKKKNNVSRE
jgi:hypothetical protein